MLYNVKVTSYGDEVQLNVYSAYIHRNDEVIKNEISKQRAESVEFFAEASEQLIEARFKNNQVRSRRRSKQVIYDLCRANQWDWFCTFTFEHDRYDYDRCKKRLQTFLHNFSNRKMHIEYLAVPEQHKDGAWHFHALIQGDVESYLTVAWNAERYQFKDYKYGINEAEYVRDSQRVSMYITKYITKELQENLKHKRRYFASKGLLRGGESFFQTELKNDMVDFIHANFPDFDISYVNTCSKGDGTVKYIQLKRSDVNV